MIKLNITNEQVKLNLNKKENVLFTNNNVGIYLNDNKDSQRQFGSIYATNYRLIYVDNNNQSKSFTINLENISKTEFYTGFLKSSPKVTIYLKNKVNKDNKNDWICLICSFLNPIDSVSCNLCGVIKDTSNNNHQNARNNSQFDNSCPKCTFKNHPLMTRCELCETTLKPLQSTTPAITPEFIRVSFRGGGEGQFYSTLKMVLEYKAWSVEDSNDKIFQRDQSAGIGGILASVDTKVQSSQSNIVDAFKDLQTLFLKADEMVKCAEQLASRLPKNKEQMTEVEKEAQYFLNSSFNDINLGIAPTATSDEESLAFELKAILHGDNGLLSGSKRNVINLDEVWCAWNRGRGVALLNPRVLIDILPYIERTTTIRSLKLQSGIIVLHNPSHSLKEFNKRLESYCEDCRGGVTTIEIAKKEELPPSLIQDFILCAQDKFASVVKDVSSGGLVRYWRNEFKDFTIENELNDYFVNWKL